MGIITHNCLDWEWPLFVAVGSVYDLLGGSSGPILSHWGHREVYQTCTIFIFFGGGAGDSPFTLLIVQGDSWWQPYREQSELLGLMHMGDAHHHRIPAFLAARRAQVPHPTLLPVKIFDKLKYVVAGHCIEWNSHLGLYAIRNSAFDMPLKDYGHKHKCHLVQCPVSVSTSRGFRMWCTYVSWCRKMEFAASGHPNARIWCCWANAPFFM